jgi:hypothetical protein
VIVGCYTLDLYCASPAHVSSGTSFGPCVGKGAEGTFGNHQPTQYTGRTEGECKKIARRDGWKFKNGDCFCPDCISAPTLRDEGGRVKAGAERGRGK